MTKSKKILSLALALVMALSVFSISVFAESAPTGTLSVSASADTIAAGDDVVITVAATAAMNYYVGPTSVPLTYDADLFEVKSVSAADIFGTDLTEKSIDTSVDGKISVILTPDTAGEPQAPNLNGRTLTLYTVTLTAKDGASGTDSIAIVNDQKTLAHTSGTLYMGSFDKAEIKDDTNNQAKLTVYGQTINFNPQTVDVTIGSTADPELVAKAGSTGYVDNVRGYVYGVPAGTTVANLHNYFEVTEGGDFTATATATGATLTVTKGGVTIATYTIIIFGDVNGDGLIDGNDAYEIQRHSCYLTELENEYLFAADVNADTFVDGNDAYEVQKHSCYLSTLSSNPWAA